MQIGSLNIDDIVSDVKVSVTKINQQKKRSLNGKLWQSYTALKHNWTLTFEMLTVEQKNSLYSLFSSTNNFTFIDEEGNLYSNCQLTNESFDNEIAYSYSGTLYYTVTLIIEEG